MAGHVKAVCPTMAQPKRQQRASGKTAALTMTKSHAYVQYQNDDTYHSGSCIAWLTTMRSPFTSATKWSLGNESKFCGSSTAIKMVLQGQVHIVN